ncbi:MAG TPA: hypothetical protein VJN69_05820 [Candidatus Acidoferrales bacterium]|nr:hypothetical protein [Candidatus Acidoferrales bacterium]
MGGIICGRTPGVLNPGTGRHGVAGMGIARGATGVAGLSGGVTVIGRGGSTGLGGGGTGAGRGATGARCAPIGGPPTRPAGK